MEIIVTKLTDKPVCPHCGNVSTRPEWSTYLAYYEEAIEEECEKCTKKYEILSSFKDVVYTTKKL